MTELVAGNERRVRSVHSFISLFWCCVRVFRVSFFFLLVLFSPSQGWRRSEELMSLVPGKTFEYRQEVGAVAANPVNLMEVKEAAAASSAAAAAAAASTPSNAAGGAAGAGGARKKPLTLVVFLGGASMSEISALRFLSEREDHARDYVVATTKLVNGQTFVESLVEQVANKLNGGTGMAGATPPTQPTGAGAAKPAGAKR